jgi:hypothetical protein
MPAMWEVIKVISKMPTSKKMEMNVTKMGAPRQRQHQPSRQAT